MSVYTTVTPEALEPWLARYDIGRLVALKGIAAGVTNTNYFVTTTQGRYVLTLFEALQLDELPFYLNLTHHLSRHGVAVAGPVADRTDQFASMLAGKPACLVHCLPGTDVSAPTPAQCAQVGAMLASMHIAGDTFPMSMPNPRGPHWWSVTAAAVYPFMAPADAALLRDELHLQNSHRYAYLPRGIIHADLFRDNVLFDGEQISGFIDFYYACNALLLYDLAIAVNDWAMLADGDIDNERARAFIDAYRAVRPLQQAEIEAWPLMLRAAAIRFWVSRLYDLHLPAAGELTYAKDPAAFQHVLERHRQRTDFWL